MKMIRNFFVFGLELIKARILIITGAKITPVLLQIL